MQNGEAEAATGPARIAGLTPGSAALLVFGLPWLLHLAVLGVPGLVTDEAHYALYGLHLDWSYFDHPPMVGWLAAAALAVSSSEFALRVVPMLLAAATAWALWRLVPRLFPDASPWVRFGTLALLQTGPALMLWGMALVPETPLILLGLLVMHTTLDLLEENRLHRWLVLGLLLGLAGLSKYTAVTLAISMACVFAWEGRWRVLRGPGPWLAALLAAALVSPVVLWNMQHDWISFRYQLDHGTGGESWEASRLATSQGQQLAYYGPLVYLGGLLALLSGWRERRQRGLRLTYAFVLPVLLLFGVSSALDKGLPHWTAFAYLAATPLTARWLAARWRHAALRRACLGWGGLMILLSLFVHSQLLVPWCPFPQGKDPTAKYLGWEDAAQEARRLLDEMAEQPGPTPHLYVDSWSRASRLAWYARPEPTQVLSNRFSQFDLWFGKPAPGDRGILVVWDDEGEDITAANVPDRRRFRSVELAGELPIERRGRRISRFLFFACHDYRD